MKPESRRPSTGNFPVTAALCHRERLFLSRCNQCACARVCTCVHVRARSFTALTDTQITQSGAWKHIKGYSVHYVRLALLSHTRTFPPTSSQSCTCSSSQFGSCSLSHFCNTVWCISAALSDICTRALSPPRLIVLASGLTPGQGEMSPPNSGKQRSHHLCARKHKTTCLMVPM